MRAKAKLCVVLFVGLCVLATVAAPVFVAADEQTAWSVNDSPELVGPQKWWYACSGGAGYGSNNCVYTYGVGGSSSFENCANWIWSEGRIGRQEIQVFVPKNNATATVSYRVELDSNEGGRRSYVVGSIAQRYTSGWKSLGTIDADASWLKITVCDNMAVQHWKDDGYVWSSIGVDAIRMRCVARCSSTPTLPHSEPTPERTPSSTIPEPTPTQRAVYDPLAPPNSLRVNRVGNKRLRVSWSPPEGISSNQASSVRYVLKLSRPALGIHGSPWPIKRSWSTTINTSNTSYLSGNLRHCVTYTAEVYAVYPNGNSETAKASQTTTNSSIMPRTPKNIEAIPENDGRYRITWQQPGANNNCGFRYKIVISRGSVNGDDGWSSTLWTNNTSRKITSTLTNGRTYNVGITAYYQNSRGNSSQGNTQFVAVDKPHVSMIVEGTGWWFIDDPDALISWNNVSGANNYYLDWRYISIDVDRLRQIYKEALDSRTSKERVKQLLNEANSMLNGRGEVPASLIGGDSKPSLDSRDLEAICNVAREQCYRRWDGGRTDTIGWNPRTSSFRVNSLDQNYVLQARVRAANDGWLGAWSDWAFVPSSVLPIACRALEAYEQIKSTLEKIDIALWVLQGASVVVGVVAAFATAGATAAAIPAIIQVLKMAAINLAKQIVKKEVLKKLMKEIIKELAKDVMERAAKEFIGHVFGCIGYGLGMSEDHLRTFLNALIDEVSNTLDPVNPGNIKRNLQNIDFNLIN